MWVEILVFRRLIDSDCQFELLCEVLLFKIKFQKEVEIGIGIEKKMLWYGGLSL